MTTGLRRAQTSYAILRNAKSELEAEQRFLTGLIGLCSFFALLTFGYGIVYPWAFVLTAMLISVSLVALAQLGESREDHRAMSKRLERAERKLNEIKNNKE